MIAAQEACWPIFDFLLERTEGKEPACIPGDLDAQDLER